MTYVSCACKISLSMSHTPFSGYYSSTTMGTTFKILINTDVFNVGLEVFGSFSLYFNHKFQTHHLNIFSRFWVLFYIFQSVSVNKTIHNKPPFCFVGHRSMIIIPTLRVVYICHNVY